MPPLFLHVLAMILPTLAGVGVVIALVAGFGPYRRCRGRGRGCAACELGHRPGTGGLNLPPGAMDKRTAPAYGRAG